MSIPKIKFIVCWNNMKPSLPIAGASEFEDFDKAWTHSQNLVVQGFEVSLAFLRRGATNAVTIREWLEVTE